MKKIQTFFFFSLFPLLIGAQKISSIEIQSGLDYNYEAGNISEGMPGTHLLATGTIAFSKFELTGGLFYDLRGHSSGLFNVFEGFLVDYHHLGIHLAIQKEIFNQYHRIGFFLAPSLLLQRNRRSNWSTTDLGEQFPSGPELSVGGYFEKRFKNKPHGLRLSYRIPVTDLSIKRIDDSFLDKRLYSISLSYIYRIPIKE